MWKTIPAHRRLVQVMLSALLVAAYAAFADQSQNTGSAAGEYSLDRRILDNQPDPLTYEPVLLQLGGDIYANLLRASSAVLNREVTLLRVAIQDAQHDLTLLRSPPEQMALETQMHTIRHELQDTGNAYDDGLWVPFKIEVDDTLRRRLAAIGRKALAATQTGKQAPDRGDRARAAAQFDAAVSAIRYSLGVFPLYKVGQYLDSAWVAAHQASPDWQTALRELQHATTSIHWYVHLPVTDLVGAYNDMDSAYRIAQRSSTENSARRRQIRDLLRRAAAQIARSSEAEPLADEVRRLMRGDKIDNRDLQVLLGDLYSRIQLEQIRAKNRYWEVIGQDVGP